MRLFFLTLAGMNIYAAVALGVQIISFPQMSLWILGPLVIIFGLFLSLSVGYIRRSLWAWYLTFPQVLFSVFYSSTSFSFLFILVPSKEIQLAQIQPVTRFLVVSGITLSLEVIKALLFFLPVFKRYFHQPAIHKRFFGKKIMAVLLVVFISFVIFSFVHGIFLL